MSDRTAEGAALAQGVGQRHALGLTLALVVPLAAVTVQWFAPGTADFPRALTLIGTVLTVLVGLAMAPDSLRLRVRQVATRFLGLVLLALAIRFAQPDPLAAWESYRAGAETLTSSRFLVPLLLFVVAIVAAQVISTKVAAAVVGARTANADRARETTAVQVWFGVTTLFLLFGAAPAGRSPWVLACLVLGPIAALFVLADLRTTLRGPDGDRPVLRGGPRRAIHVTAGVALAGVVGLAGVGLALLPDRTMEGLGRPSEWVGDAFDWDFRQRTGQRDGVVGGGEHADREDDAEGVARADRTSNIFSNVADPPWWLIAGLVALVAWAVFRPKQWGRLLQRLWLLLRGAMGLSTDAGDTEAWSGDVVAGRGPSRLRQALQRLLPRPRDPRQAVIYDYLRVERALERGNDDDHALARELWETPLEHAERVTLGEAHAELAALTSTARFAREAPSATDAERSLELRHAVERLVREHDVSALTPTAASPGWSDQPPVT